MKVDTTEVVNDDSEVCDSICDSIVEKDADDDAEGVERVERDCEADDVPLFLSVEVAETVAVRDDASEALLAEDAERIPDIVPELVPRRWLAEGCAVDELLPEKVPNALLVCVADMSDVIEPVLDRRVDPDSVPVLDPTILTSAVAVPCRSLDDGEFDADAVSGPMVAGIADGDTV